MWNRKDLKVKGKASFRANYWKSVLVALVPTIAMVGGTSAAWSGGHGGGTVAANDSPIALSIGGTVPVIGS